MKSWLNLSVMFLLVVGLVSTVEAKAKGGKKPAAPDPGLTGAVVKVDGKNLIIKSAAGETTVATDDSTVVVINGVTSKLSDLQADQQVKVTPSYGTAQRIEVGATDTPAATAPDKGKAAAKKKK